jgi:hypothetical protein
MKITLTIALVWFALDGAAALARCQVPDAPPKNAWQLALEADAARCEARSASVALAESDRAQAKARAERMRRFLGEARQHRAQVLVGLVTTRDGRPVLEQDGWRADADYFYPASTIKLAGAVAALERMNALRRERVPELDERVPLAFHPIRRTDRLLADDSDNLDGGKLTLEHVIREALIVSDNESYNRLYDFSGQDWLNDRMARAGLSSFKLSHRLSIQMSTADNKRTPIVELRFPTGPVLIEARTGTKDLSLERTPDVYIGREHMQGDSKVKSPMSFFYKNRATLRDLQGLMVRVARPDIALPGEPFDLTDAQRAFLLDSLKCLPGDSANPRYAREQFPDDFAKFFRPGLLRAIGAADLELYNKVGLAYGFALDNAYVVDKARGLQFFLTAVVYADADGVVNDNQYEYETAALPWLADVAEIVARELAARKQ